MTSRKNREEPILSRRGFLKQLAIKTTLASGIGAWGYLYYSKKPVREFSEKIYILKDFRVPHSGLYPMLSIIHGKDPTQMVRAAIESLGGMSRFIKPGDKVLIKPNAGWDRQPEQAANTNPYLVGAVVKECFEAKASEVWVTDASVNDPYRCFARSGIEKETLNAGGKILFSGSNDFLSTDLKGELIKVWPVVKYYHMADKVINMPIVKHHSLTGCTLSMKNWYGILGGERNRLHQKIGMSIVDLAAAMRPTLTILDAIRVLKRNGPTGGKISDVSVENTIIAGLDEVAMDSLALKYLDLKPSQVEYLTIAQERGLGISNWSSLRVTEKSTA